MTAPKIVTLYPAPDRIFKYGRSTVSVFHNFVGGSDDGRTSLRVAASTPYGEFATTWPNIGPGDWREFPQALDQSYLIGSMRGRSDVACINDTMRRVRQWINDQRSDGVMSITVANKLRTKMREIAANHIPEQDEASISMVIFTLRSSDLDLDDIASFCGTRPDPKCTAFFTRVWTPFANHVAEELAAELEVKARVERESNDVPSP